MDCVCSSIEQFPVKVTRHEFREGLRSDVGAQSPIQANSGTGQDLFRLAFHFLNHAAWLRLFEIQNNGNGRWKGSKAFSGKPRRDNGAEYAKRSVTHDLDRENNRQQKVRSSADRTQGPLLSYVGGLTSP